MTTPSPMTYEQLCRSSFGELERIMQQGQAPALDSLVGWEFRGYNVLALMELVRNRKFKKGFEALPDRSDELAGYNVLVQQNGLDGPWLAKLRHGEPERQFPYAVRPVSASGRDRAYPGALLLDYNVPGKLALDPTGWIRDYLVQVEPQNPDLLLGKAYVALGPARVPVTFFVLERYNRAL